MNSTLIKNLRGRTADGSPLKELHYAFIVNDIGQVLEIRNYDFKSYEPKQLYSIRMNAVLGEIRSCKEKFDELKRLSMSAVKNNDTEEYSKLVKQQQELIKRQAKLSTDDSVVSRKPREEKKIERVGGIIIN